MYSCLSTGNADMSAFEVLFPIFTFCLLLWTFSWLCRSFNNDYFVFVNALSRIFKQWICKTSSPDLPQYFSSIFQAFLQSFSSISFQYFLPNKLFSSLFRLSPVLLHPFPSTTSWWVKTYVFLHDSAPKVQKIKSKTCQIDKNSKKWRHA